jgi:hypothetical protein
MIKDFPGEKWKKVEFSFDFTNRMELFVSNFGRLKTSNRYTDGRLLNGSKINGYKIIRLKLFKPRLPKTQAAIDRLQKQVLQIAKEITQLSGVRGNKKTVKEKEVLLKSLKNNLARVYKQDGKYRTINFHALVHRLVADYFLPVATSGQTKVAHMDYNKLNNRAANLKWMTPEENYRHQQNSPYVIHEKQQRKLGLSAAGRNEKLTVTKVMLLKKLLNQQKPVRQLVKQFKISDMQVYRIKRGENWGHIPAAE